MSDWRALGLEKCSKCDELFTWNSYYFPLLYLKLLTCKECLEEVE